MNRILKSESKKVERFNACDTCIEFAGSGMTLILEAILMYGIDVPCNTFCNVFQNDPAAENLCTVLCDGVGIAAFADFFIKADLDPIYACELLNECKVNDNGDAKITKFDILPNAQPQGIFYVDLEYVSKNGTGTGEIVINIETLDDMPFAFYTIKEYQPAGEYETLIVSTLKIILLKGTFNTKIQIKAEEDPSTCDPRLEQCESWMPGLYKVSLCALKSFAIS